MSKRSARSGGVISRRVPSLIIGLMLTQAGCGAAMPASASPTPHKGVVIVSIQFTGGPAPLANARRDVAGVVTVFTAAGREVVRGTARAGHGVRFVLTAGPYQLHAGRQLHSKDGCRPTIIAVHADRIMRVNVQTGCNIP